MVNWGIASVVGDCSATSAGDRDVDAGLDAAKKYRAYIASARLPAVGESEQLLLVRYPRRSPTSPRPRRHLRGRVRHGEASTTRPTGAPHPGSCSGSPSRCRVGRDRLASIGDGRALAGVSLCNDAERVTRSTTTSRPNPGPTTRASIQPLRTFDGEVRRAQNNPRLMPSPTSDFRTSSTAAS